MDEDETPATEGDVRSDSEGDVRSDSEGDVRSDSEGQVTDVKVWLPNYEDGSEDGHVSKTVSIDPENDAIPWQSWNDYNAKITLTIDRSKQGEPELEVRSMDVRPWIPDEYKPGKSAYVEAAVKNTGEGPAGEWVPIKIDGCEASGLVVHAKTGETAEASNDFILPEELEEGEHEVKVGEKTRTITVVEDTGTGDSETGVWCPRGQNSAGGSVDIPARMYEKNEPVKTGYQTQGGKYRLELSRAENESDGWKKVREQVIEPEDRREGTLGHKFREEGKIKAELVAPGTWWKPWDNGETIDDDTAEVREKPFVQGMKLDVNDDSKVSAVDLKSLSVEEKGYPDFFRYDYNCDKSVNHGDKERLSAFLDGTKDIEKCDRDEPGIDDEENPDGNSDGSQEDSDYTGESVWRNYCIDRGFEKSIGTAEKGLKTCITGEIAESCFVSDPSRKCRDVGKSLCKDMLGTGYEFKPSSLQEGEGPCVEE
jgi:hypothetical protein